VEKESGKTSKLHPSVQQLIRMIFDIETMKKTMLEFEVKRLTQLLEKTVAHP